MLRKQEKDRFQQVSSNCIKARDSAIFQPEMEQESDDDCEVYFLKPVNEYNIVDKIREANKELFYDEIGNELELIADSQQSRKVSFATNLEEYEPEKGINIRELEVSLGKIDEEEENFLKLDQQKLEIINEEKTISNIESNEICVGDIKQDHEDPVKLPNENWDNSDNCDKLETNQFKACVNEEENIALEEICEEILIMDIESERPKVANVNNYERAGMQCKMLKQITFDFTEENDEIDNKSLTNLLMSDNQNNSNEEEEFESQEYNCQELLNDDIDSEDSKLLTNVEYCNEDGDKDDKLSIIVASYLTGDVYSDKSSLISLNLKNSSSLKTNKLPFNKRFSLQRKAKSSNAISSCTDHRPITIGHFIPPPEVTDLKLHYKTCCEYKNAQQNLPKYTGYVSEYGLSREQLVERERKLHKKKQNRVVETIKTSELKMQKIHDNERAFITWLKNKMRFPINKTRNMFDAKRPFGLRKCTSLSGNYLNDDTRQILGATKFRSIGAKFKKE